MPNFCSFDMRIVGKKEDVDLFVKELQADYNYNTNTFSEEYHIGARVFEFSVTNIDYNGENDDIAVVDGFGECAWSVETCMMEGSGYVSDLKNNYGEKCRCKSLAEESKRLNVDVEVLSEEPGCEFQEHILIKHGEVLINDCRPYRELYIDDIDCDKETAEKELDKKLTAEEWEEFETTGCYHLTEFENFEFEIG